MAFTDRNAIAWEKFRRICKIGQAYSQRKVTMGSTRVARRAGKQRYFGARLLRFGALEIFFV
jgi:hypothetical protein